MKKIQWFWNLVYYNVFIFENKVSSVILYPFCILFKSNRIQRIYKSRGIDNINQLVRDTIMNPAEGSNSLIAGGTMGVLTAMLFIGLYCVYIGAFLTEFGFNEYLMISFIALSYGANHILLWKNDRYLKYFRDFNEMPKRKKITYGWMSFLFIVVLLAFLILSFMYALSAPDNLK